MLNKSFITDTVSFFQGVPAARAPQVNRITMRYLEDYDVLSPLYCATKLLQLGKYYAEFAAGISQVLAMEGGFGWVQVGDPDAADLEHHEECCRSCIPNLHLLGEEAKAETSADRTVAGPDGVARLPPNSGPGGRSSTRPVLQDQRAGLFEGEEGGVGAGPEVPSRHPLRHALVDLLQVSWLLDARRPPQLDLPAGMA